MLFQFFRKKSDFKIKNHVLTEYLGNSPDVVIPEGVTQIQKGAFSSHRNMRSLKFPDSMTNIKGIAFFMFFNLESITLPANLTAVPAAAFWGCRKLKYVNIPEHVTSIGESAFLNCQNLKNITLPEQLETIGTIAFQGCALKNIAIPDSVNFIGLNAFDCRTLTSFTRYGIEVSRKRILQYDFESVVHLKAFLDYHDDVYARQHIGIPFLFRIDTEHFRICLESGKFFTQENIDEAIRTANQKQLYEKQRLLTEYKYQHFGFEEIGERLKL